MAEYVDKNDVYRAARESLGSEGALGIVAVSILESAIKQLPAEDVKEARHAEWKDHSDNEHERFMCTNCAFVVREPCNYCPFCGARMKW